MNDGLLSGFGEGAPGVPRRGVWQLFDTSVSNVPLNPSAKYVSWWVVGGGGGGGSGRYALATNASGGGGGSSADQHFERRVPVAYLRRLQIESFTVTIGAGGTGGAANTTIDTSGNNGTAGGLTQIDWNARSQWNGSGFASYSFQTIARNGNAGSGGTTTSGGFGSTPNPSRPGTMPGSGGSAGSTGAPFQANQVGNAYGLAGRGLNGGTGGSGKGVNGGLPVHPGRLFFDNSGNAAMAFGTDGIDAIYFGEFLFNLILAMPSMPPFDEMTSYLWGGGGGGTGSASTSGASGRGGDGYRGSGGGGGGGSAGGTAGRGGNGGRGFALFCWEFQ